MGVHAADRELMGLLDTLLIQIAEAKADGAVIDRICAHPSTVHQAWSENEAQSFFMSFGDATTRLFGYDVQFMNELPTGVWVLAFKHRFVGLRPALSQGVDLADGMDWTTVMARLQSGVITADQAREQISRTIVYRPAKP
jgi:hypothetical protein